MEKIQVFFALVLIYARINSVYTVEVFKLHAVERFSSISDNQYYIIIIESSKSPFHSYVVIRTKKKNHKWIFLFLCIGDSASEDEDEEDTSSSGVLKHQHSLGPPESNNNQVPTSLHTPNDPSKPGQDHDSEDQGNKSPIVLLLKMKNIILTFNVSRVRF